MKDKIFLLSIDEYKKYEANIPHIRCKWWLRSPGIDSNHAAGVDINGYVNYYGSLVYCVHDAVRPALHLESPAHKIGDRVIEAGFPWIVIDKGIAIAEVPIAFRWFDPTDNDYDVSEIRQFLMDWYEERKTNEQNKQHV